MWLLPSRQTRCRGPARAPASTFLPRLEALEDRCLPSSGPLDPTFGSGGIATSAVTANLAADSMALQPDGKVLAAGTVSTSSTNKFGLTRYTASGSLDTAFGSGGEVTTKIGNGADAFAMALYPNAGTANDGKVVVAGSASSSRTGNDFALARYNANGSLDTSFGSRGTVMTSLGPWDDEALAVLIQPDGKILAAGDSRQVAANGKLENQFALVRYNANGSLDTSFGSGGIVLTVTDDNALGNYRNAILGLALQSDGKIVVAGYVAVPNTNASSGIFTVARYNANGTLDTTFGAGHTGIVYLSTTDYGDRAQSVVIQADGKIVVAGGVRLVSVTSPTEWALARFNTDGSLDGTFGSGGEVTGAAANDWAYAVALQADGKIVIAGSHSASQSFLVGRVNTDGSLDTTFNGTGIVTTQVGTWSAAGGVAIQPADGKIVVAGNSSLGAAVARYLAAGPQVGSFTASPNPVTAGSNVTLTAANVTDPNPGGTVTQVAFYLDSNGDGKLEPGTDTLLGYGTQTGSTWTLTFSTAGLVPGSYTLFAQAEDNYGLFSNPFALTLAVL